MNGQIGFAEVFENKTHTITPWRREADFGVIDTNTVHGQHKASRQSSR